MRTFLQFITEVLTSSLPWAWKEGPAITPWHVIATFVNPTNQIEYEVRFSVKTRYGPRPAHGYGDRPLLDAKDWVWVVVFSAGGKGYYQQHQQRMDQHRTDIANEVPFPERQRVSGPYGILGSGGAVPVFATIIDILKDFVAKKSPKRVIFSSDKDEPSRTKLYRRLVDRASSINPQYKGQRTPKVRSDKWLARGYDQFEISRKEPRKPRTPRPLTTEEPESAHTVAPREDPPTRGTQL